MNRSYLYGLIWLLTSLIVFSRSPFTHATEPSFGQNIDQRADQDSELITEKNLPLPSPSTVPVKVLVFGDSLSASYNIPTDKGWVNLLQRFVDDRQIPLTLINASISGETTSGGALRLPRQLQLHQPDIVLIELGGNDGLRGLDLETTQKNLEKMIVDSLASGSKVLLSGIRLPPNYGRTYTRRFESIFSHLQQVKEIPLIPFILEDVATRPALMQPDGIHPNASGQPLIMQTVWRYLEPLL